MPLIVIFGWVLLMGGIILAIYILRSSCRTVYNAPNEQRAQAAFTYGLLMFMVGIVLASAGGIVLLNHYKLIIPF